MAANKGSDKENGKLIGGLLFNFYITIAFKQLGLFYTTWSGPTKASNSRTWNETK